MNDTLKIGPLVYTVEEIPDLKDTDGSTFLFGSIRYSEQAIKVDAGMSAERKRITVLHEAIHAISDMRGLNLSEKQVVALGVAIYELFHDNPWLGVAV